MDVNQLKYFISVAQTLNFTEAARRNGLTQPSISHHINELEKQVGATLFYRDRRSVTMTDAGKELLPYAVEIVEKTRNAIDRINQTKQGSQGRISIAAVTTCTGIIRNCLSAFAEKYPDILVDISFTTGRGQTITMNENKFDFYFALEDMVPSGNTFEYMVTHDDQLVLILPEGHPMAEGPLDYAELAKEKFISISEAEGPMLNSQILAVCEDLNFKPRIVNTYDTAETVLIGVRAGLGISIVPNAITKVFNSSKVVVRELPSEHTKRSYVFAWCNNNPNQSAKLFFDVAKDVISKWSK